MSTLTLLYEPEHAEALERLRREKPHADETVVVFDRETEMRLEKKNIPYFSGRSFLPTDTGRYSFAREWPVQMFNNPLWKEFSYRGVPLSLIFTIHVQAYLLKLLHWATTFDNLISAHPHVQRLIVFPSLGETPVKGKPLTREQLDAVVRCAELVGKHHGLEVVVIPKAANQARGPNAGRIRFASRQLFLGWGADLWNICMTLLPRKRGAIRILVTDYWRNIAPLLKQVTNPELVLFDRGEAAHAGLQNLLRFRMRLCNFSSFSLWGRYAARARLARSFAHVWATHSQELLPECSYNGLSLRPPFEAVIDEIVNRLVPGILRDIDGAYALLTRTAPDLVLLRASISIQTHFTVLALVARELHIPSLELQHGLEYLGPGSLSTTHHAEYVAVYGQAVQDEFVALGYARERVPVIGSPRFDAYAARQKPLEKKEHTGLSVLCITSTADNEGGFNGYDADTYLTTIARTLENIPGASAIVKLRPGLGYAYRDWYRDTISTAFARVPHAIAQTESLSELFARADIVVSYYSTTVLEALQSGMPTALFSMIPIEKEMISFHFTRYREQKALVIALTPDELGQALQNLASDAAVRSELGEAARRAMAQLHQFDGHASKRLATFITNLANHKFSSTR